MLLTLSTTHRPATDLGFLLHKHPQRAQRRELPFGYSTVFYPEASEERCAAALLLTVDPVSLSRTARPGEGAPLEPYVNDRPYASGSFLAAALRDAFGTALAGTCKARPDLAQTALPLVAEVPCVSVQGPAELPQRLFGPLGYEVEAELLPLDPLSPEWGEGRYQALRLSGTLRLQDLLRHLYVLLPVLDGRKHSYLDEAEVEKLRRQGEGWLGAHPERDLIAARYLRLRSLVRQAQADFSPQEHAAGEPEEAPRPRAHDERLDRVAELLRASGAARVLDLGCGEGQLLRRLLPHAGFRELAGMDVSARPLRAAAARLGLDERPELRERVRLFQSSLSYPDSRLRGYDAAALTEVIEHLEPHRVAALTEHVLGDARPGLLVVTTPNREYNAVFGDDSPQMRHADHRFEWSRAEFRAWAEEGAARYGYEVRFEGVGPTHPEFGPLTQLAVFIRTH